jgi:hypothetical protein
VITIKNKKEFWKSLNKKNFKYLSKIKDKYRLRLMFKSLLENEKF